MAQYHLAVCRQLHTYITAQLDSIWTWSSAQMRSGSTPPRGIELGSPDKQSSALPTKLPRPRLSLGVYVTTCPVFVIYLLKIWVHTFVQFYQFPNLLQFTIQTQVWSFINTTYIPRHPYFLSHYKELIIRIIFITMTQNIWAFKFIWT